MGRIKEAWKELVRKDLEKFAIPTKVALNKNDWEMGIWKADNK